MPNSKKHICWASPAVPYSSINFYYWKNGVSLIHLFSINYWVVPIFHPNSPQIIGVYVLLICSCIGTRLLEDCKSNSSVTLKLLLGYLSIYELLRKDYYWRCSPDALG